jgi:quinol-cytochrome oxidoreductase complex cytochrome b subunit
MAVLVAVHAGELVRAARDRAGVGILFALLVLLPFLDRSPRRSWRNRPVAIALTVLVVITLIVLTVLINVITPEAHL